MEELILGQVRGLMIIANWHKVNGNLSVYYSYLRRAEKMLKSVESQRVCHELKAS